MSRIKLLNSLDLTYIKRNNPDLISRIIAMDEIHFKYFLKLGQIEGFLNSNNSSYIIETFMEIDDSQLCYFVDVIRKYVELKYDNNIFKLIQFYNFVDIKNFYYKTIKALDCDSNIEKAVNNIIYILFNSKNILDSSEDNKIKKLKIAH